ncbi:MAG: bifunctional phosphoribosylaminoimidazolecarboxamide formyltransferase/IMP cyclohydrolase, partial [Bosea sp. (in: a-proteobacteria)]
MPTELRRVERALLSVSDKTGLIDFARALHAQGVALVSTGGTAKALSAAGLPVSDVSDLTGFPEMMDGRVKTLHPKVHGGLLAVRSDPEHQASMIGHGIAPIDLLVVNLYPFEATVAAGKGYDDCIENIDIGGPAMIRAAAKNHHDVAVVVDGGDYAAILAELSAHQGKTTLTLRRKLAQKAYARTAAYDAAISNWFADQLGETAPAYRALGGALAEPLRYGENPHQWAAFYRTPEARPGVSTARQVQGKQLSYNNINDTDAAFECVAEFDPATSAACVIVKHANPCGVATGGSLLAAYERALACDPVSAFGGIVALNRRLDAQAARKIVEVFTEVIIAPDADEEAIALIAAKKNLRLLLTGGLPDMRKGGLSLRTVSGGFLAQARDSAVVDDMELKVVTARKPSETELADLRFAFRVAKHVKSNAIVYVKDGATVGIGAGQMSRVDSSRIAAWKAAEAAKAAGLPETLAKG